MALDSFDGPKLVSTWAREELDEFEPLAQAYVDSNPPKKFVENDPLTGEWIHGVTFPDDTPTGLEKRAYRIVNDLRNALDQSTFAASKALGRTRLKATNFPFGEDAEDFKAVLLTKRHRDIPEELHPALTSFQPYWPTADGGDGNKLLRALALIANPNKHQVPLRIGAFSVDISYYTMENVKSFGPCNHRKNKVELWRTLPFTPHNANVHVNPRVGFEGVPVLSGKPIIATLREMHAIVDGIILGLEAETTRLLGS